MNDKEKIAMLKSRSQPGELNPNFKHGGTSKGHPLYRTYKVWVNMHDRCIRETHKFYSRYGGRGIKVCARWGDFETFVTDVGIRPEGMTIDRIDNNRDYEPGNVRWSTSTQQNRNRSNSVKIEWRGEAKTAGEWAEATGINEKAINRRLIMGWSVGKTLSIPVRGHKKYKPRTVVSEPEHAWDCAKVSEVEQIRSLPCTCAKADGSMKRPKRTKAKL